MTGPRLPLPTRRRAAVAVGLAAALLVTACGDDEPAGTVPDETLPPVEDDDGDDDPDGDEHAFPTGADDVVLRIAYEGGFVPVDVAFRDLPAVLVTGDGRVFQEGPTIAVYPGPLLPNIQVRTISEEGIEDLLALAEQHDLFTEQTYDGPDNVADAPDTVVEIAIGADGGTVEHRAYALGLDGGPGGSEPETDPGREALASFVEAATELVTGPADDVLGPEEPYEPDAYRIRAAVATDDGTTDDGLEPTEADWPADASVRLADATECAIVPADEVGEVFAAADQLTRFVDEGVAYEVFVAPVLPGQDGC
ncbi:MAG: hypothetical protein WD225_03280 [Ilumatobacteraceae bacterium]